MKINIGITDTNLKKIYALLNKTLADANVFYIKLRKFHWNIKGPDFMEYHLLFEKQYEGVEKAIDEIAERISSLGGVAVGTTAEFAKLSQLKESPGKVPSELEMLKELLADHETMIRSLRDAIEKCDEDYKDAGTADFLTDLIREHEKNAWKIRQYIK
ncbi:MAG: DNA starvation/stationary phase protection protein [Chitinophagaceae bacterium]|nr:MAG: DNA starvation/stationary phase protection protein [Chitinophagaceae bacterium]